jgi:hypothetical protein
MGFEVLVPLIGNSFSSNVVSSDRYQYLKKPTASLFGMEQSLLI